MGCNMKNAVYVHQDYDIEELKRMLKHAVLAFDTNALLGLYSYSPKILQDIKGLLTKDTVKNRLFVPYHTAEEFYKNKDRVIQRVQSIYSSKLGGVTSAINALQQDINKTHFLSDWVVAAKTKLQKAVETMRETYKAQEVDFDKTSETIEEIFYDGCVGHELENSEFYENEFEKRLKYDIPPGITDSQKKQNKSGDFIIWSELLGKAKVEKTDIIFVTNEKKFDWWDKCDKDRPNKQLLVEFNKKTGQRCYFFNMDSFIRSLAEEQGYALEYDVAIPIENTEYDTMLPEEQVIEDKTVAEEKNFGDQAG